MIITYDQESNTSNVFIPENPQKMVLCMIVSLLALKLWRKVTSSGGHLGFIQYGRHRGSPAWLPQEIDRRWSYLPLVQKWCLWNNLNNHGALGD